MSFVYVLCGAYKNTTVVCLGTATTIDLVTGTGVYFSGSILPGIDVSYQGLLDRATSLPALSDLPLSDKMLNTNTAYSLYTGLFLVVKIRLLIVLFSNFLDYLF